MLSAQLGSCLTKKKKIVLISLHPFNIQVVVISHELTISGAFLPCSVLKSFTFGWTSNMPPNIWMIRSNFQPHGVPWCVIFLSQLLAIFYNALTLGTSLITEKSKFSFLILLRKILCSELNWNQKRSVHFTISSQVWGTAEEYLIGKRFPWQGVSVKDPGFRFLGKEILSLQSMQLPRSNFHGSHFFYFKQIPLSCSTCNFKQNLFPHIKQLHWLYSLSTLQGEGVAKGTAPWLSQKAIGYLAASLGWDPLQKSVL